MSFMAGMHELRSKVVGFALLATPALLQTAPAQAPLGSQQRPGTARPLASEASPEVKTLPGGITLQLGKQCTGVEQQGNTLRVAFGDGESVECDLMLV